MALSNRLKERRENLGLKQSDIAQELGVTPAAIGNYENGISTPKAEILFKVFDALKCDANYLFQDEMKELPYDDKANPNEMNHIKKYRSLDTHGKKSVDLILQHEYDRVRQAESVHEEIAFPKIIQVPFIAQLVSAGPGETIIDNLPIEVVDIPNSPKYRNASYAIKAKGRSMEPLYNDSDILIVEKTDAIDIGEIGVFISGGQSYVKKFGNNELISLNKNYENISIDESTRCMGKVIGALEEKR